MRKGFTAKLFSWLSIGLVTTLAAWSVTGLATPASAADANGDTVDSMKIDYT